MKKYTPEEARDCLVNLAMNPERRKDLREGIIVMTPDGKPAAVLLDINRLRSILASTEILPKYLEDCERVDAGYTEDYVETPKLCNTSLKTGE